MITCVRAAAASRASDITAGGTLRLAPLARAIALAAASGAIASGAQAQHAFSPAWFGAKGALQSTATATGRLPNGQPASSLTDPSRYQARANEQVQRSIRHLNQAAQSIAAQQAAQAAARLAAAQGQSLIPDGLAEGGLEVDAGSLTAGWLNAKAPVQSAQGGQTTVTIEQTAEKAILNWETFNVGRNTTVNFDQRAGTSATDGSNHWIALNRVNDPSGRPSQIAGRINADGAVYIINRNGIVFTGSSQVNASTLVAASLRLTDEQFNKGINKPSYFPGFAGTDYAIPTFGDYGETFLPLFGSEMYTPGAAPGAVEVQAGARLDVDAGGKLMLFAPKVRNAGRLSAPDGQIIMAAGENVFLKTAENETGTSGPPEVRGLEVAVAAPAPKHFSYYQARDGVYGIGNGVEPMREVMDIMDARAAQIGYEVVNAGMAEAERGNITMQSLNVTQNGVLSATTALNNRNGSIVLRAWGQGTHAFADSVRQMRSWSSGTLTLAPGSVTTVTPDAGDTSEIEASALATRYAPGSVRLYGKLVDIQSEATVRVPAGIIDVRSAASAFTIQEHDLPGTAPDGSRIYLDGNAFLSVAGLQEVEVPMARNFIEAELRINELRDSPLLRDSWLRGKKVVIDRRAAGQFGDGVMSGVQWVPDGKGGYVPGAWVGTPLGDMTGWVGVGKTDLAEISTSAGSISLVTDGGEVVARPGSLMDIAGGSVRYGGGMNTATKLVGADGRIYPIAQATPDMIYVGIAGQYEQQHGRWGVSNTWKSAVLGADHHESGYLEGRSAGAIQINAGAAIVLEGEIWAGATQADRDQAKPARPGGSLTVGGGAFTDTVWSPGHVIITPTPLQLPADFGADAPIPADWYVAERPDAGDGKTSFEKHTYLSDAMLNRSGLGVINLFATDDSTIVDAAALDLFPGTQFNLYAVENAGIDIAVHGQIRAPGGAIRLETQGGDVMLGAGSRLDVAGMWANAWQGGGAGAPWAVDAGSISMLQTNPGDGRLIAEAGAVLDASGGGRIYRAANGKPAIGRGDGGELMLGGVDAATGLSGIAFIGHAPGAGASLLLGVAADVQMGGTDAPDGTIVLPPSLYADKGFRELAIRGSGRRVTVPDGAKISQEVVSVDLGNAGLADWTKGASGMPERLATLRPDQRLARSPNRLAIDAGEIVIGQGASIRTDLGGAIEFGHLQSGASIDVRGTLEAPAGSIRLNAARIVLDDGAQLLARGADATYRNSQGWRVGTVLPGGRVELASENLDMRRGALIDVSGAAGIIDSPPGIGGYRFGDTHGVAIASRGGSIAVTGGGVVEGTLRGHAGGAGTAGGSVSFEFAPPPGDPGGSPLEQIQSMLSVMDPDCYGIAGDGICGSNDWSEALGVDWRPYFLDFWGIAIETPMVLPPELQTLLAGSRNFIVSDTVPGNIAVKPPLDPADFGLTPEALDLFRDYFIYTDALREAFQSPGQDLAMIVRPSTISGGGFADLALSTVEQAPIRLDGVSLTLGRSISITGEIAQYREAASRLSAPVISLGGTAASAEPARAGAGGLAGRLTLDAQLVDVRGETTITGWGSRIGGFDQTLIEADEVRLGRLPGESVDFAVDGSLVIRSAQIYPGTATSATVRAGDLLRIERMGGASAPLSAGGRLTMQAPVIEQHGVLRAPHGQLVLDAAERLVLGTGSVTSVSGTGVVVPYGVLRNNEHWRDPAQIVIDETDPTQGLLDAPPEKRVELKAPEVDMADGALVDISGGGDLYAWEFVPGPGGSHDVLTQPGMYAILPGYDGASPEAGAAAGERIWLAGGPGLAAGWYALLPARYALLPGAFAVQPTDKTWTGIAAGATQAADGSLVMQGRRGNGYGETQDAQASAWRVLSGDIVRRYTEYNEAMANDFFSSDAFKLTQYRLTGQNIVTPRLPRDGGAAVFSAGRSLTLDGRLHSQPGEQGRGGLLDITGEKIAIVGAGQDPADLIDAGFLLIDAQDLSGFGAGSVLIGGTRRGDPLGLALDVTASNIVVRNDAGSVLAGPEIILAASELLSIDAGSVVEASGNPAAASDLIVAPQQAAEYNDNGTPDDPADDTLIVPERDWGTLLRVAAGDAARVVRHSVDTTRGGQVRIGERARVEGSGALLIDATRTTDMASSAVLGGRDLSVASGRIGFGGDGEGLLLDAAALAQLSRTESLTLRSYSSFDFHQSADLQAAGLRAVIFDGGEWAGYGDQDVTVRGATVILLNSGQEHGPAGGGAGSLILAADTIVLDEGKKRISGFGTVALEAADRIIGQGQGELDAGAAALTLRTPLLTGGSAASLALRTTGVLDVLASGDANGPGQEAAPHDSLGARLALTGGSVRVGGRIAALGGTIAVTAVGGDITLEQSSIVDVGGFARQFYDLSEYGDAGRVELTAVDGSVRVEAGSRLNLSAQAGGGSAGTLALAAGNGGRVLLEGDVRAHAGEGGLPGSLSLDIDALPDFAGFNARLNDAGFLYAREFRIRTGDVTVDGGTTVERLLVAADRGHVNIAGRIDARAAYGGSIRIVGGGGVSMSDGAELLAGATAAIGSGRVTLDAAGGRLDLAGGSIDVSGGEGGRILVRAQRTENNLDLAMDRLATRIAGARSAVVEGTRTYESDSVDAVRQAAVDEANAFAARRDAIAGRLGTAPGWTVAAGIEIVADGDLALATDWNLFEDLTASRGGSLTLRAAGNLIIGGHLSDGFDRADRTGALQDTQGWNLNLAAGADLSAADRLALRPHAAIAENQGSIIVGRADTDPGEEDNGTGKLVRTGTGDLSVRAGRDVRLAHKESVIYTAGRRDPTTWSDFTTARADAAYGIEGGHLDIVAQGAVSAQPSGQRFVQWLNRQGAVNADHYFGDYLGGEYGELPDGSYGPIRRPAEQSSWWIDYGMFQQGVGALGGGNVSVHAGGDLSNLVVALPTNMRMRGGRSATEARVMETRNGGALTVEAGGAILGGQYYVARGAGRIRAGETGTGHEVTVTIADWDGGRDYVFPLSPILAVGDATLSVRTQGNLQVQSVIDPLMVRYGSDGSGDLPQIVRGAYMSGYTGATALDLVSVGGSISLVNQADYAFRDVTLESHTTDQDNLIGYGGNLYPAQLKIVAMNGGVEIQGPLYVMPSTDNDVTLAAQADLRFGRPDALRYARDGYRLQLAEPGLYMAYATPEMIPSPAMPVGFEEHLITGMATLLRNEIGTASLPLGSAYFNSVANPEVLPLANDHAPSRIYAGGSIDGLNLIASEQTWVRAGRDIRGLHVLARNLRPSDVTLLEAGNDILEVGTPLSEYFNHIEVQGPGALVLSAGRDIYANKLRVMTLGSVGRYDDNNRPLNNAVIRGLPAQGASISALAGINGDVAYDAFADSYLNPGQVGGMPSYLTQTAVDGTVLPLYLTDGVETREDGTSKTTRRGLVSYVKAMTGEELAPLAAWERFQALPALVRQQFLRQVLLLELRDAGRDQNFPGENGLPRNGGYNRGYAAIEALFPGDGWRGDIAANNLMLRTMAGGDISVLTPGGGLQLAALGATVPPGHGLVTLASGHINVFARDDVTVNRSRLLSFVPAATREGSDQIVWSTLGDIDAGRGAKTVRVPSSADIVTDEDGNTEMRERSDMSGSGIGTVGDGDVDLVAPVGTVNAGDAGIRVAGNLNVAALYVLNAENIQVKGKVTGLPAVAAVNVGALTAASAAASQAAAAAQEVLQQERKAARNSLPSVFTVRVLGFGSEPAPATDRQEGAMGDEPATSARGSDPASYIQIVGAGRHFDAGQLARLTPAERHQLMQER